MNATLRLRLYTISEISKKTTLRLFKLTNILKNYKICKDLKC